MIDEARTALLLLYLKVGVVGLMELSASSSAAATSSYIVAGEIMSSRCLDEEQITSMLYITINSGGNAPLKQQRFKGDMGKCLFCLYKSFVVWLLLLLCYCHMHILAPLLVQFYAATVGPN